MRTVKQAFNPFLPGYEYIPDGEPRLFDGRVYVYGSHDDFNGKTYCVKDYTLWSAPEEDLADWRCEGTIYKRTQDPLCADPEKDFLFAPDAERGPDGRYYLFYSLNNSSVISVAVCDKPAGEYEFYGHVHYPDGTLLGRRAEDPFQFDPGIYVEGNEVYLYSGFCPRNGKMWEAEGLTPPPIKGPMVIRLETDMLTVKRGPEIIAPYVNNSEGTGYEGHEFFEAPSMRKVGDRYYFIYSSINGHELCYAVSGYPDRDFQYGGVIISNGDIFEDGPNGGRPQNYYGNNHGSIIDIRGQWYIFYHRHTNRIQFDRQACADKIYFEPDGHIPQAELTSCGLNHGPLKGTGIYEARIACNLWGRNGAKLYGLGDRPMDESHPYFTQEDDGSGQPPYQYIANLTEGSAAGFKYFDIRDTSGIRIRFRGTGEGTVTVKDAPDGKKLGEMRLFESEKWDWAESALLPAKEVSALFFLFNGRGHWDFCSFELENFLHPWSCL